MIHAYSFVLASTQDLHVKINELSNRVRSLEDALRASHSQLSNEPHPLLHDELLKIKHPLQRDTTSPNGMGGSRDQEPKEEPADANIVDAVGSLSVTDSGRTKYFGHAANSYVRLDFPFLSLWWRIALTSKSLHVQRHVQYFLHVRSAFPCLLLTVSRR
jgi:hypothetical protein